MWNLQIGTSPKRTKAAELTRPLRILSWPSVNCFFLGYTMNFPQLFLDQGGVCSQSWVSHHWHHQALQDKGSLQRWTQRQDQENGMPGKQWCHINNSIFYFLKLIRHSETQKGWIHKFILNWQGLSTALESGFGSHHTQPATNIHNHPGAIRNQVVGKDPCTSLPGGSGFQLATKQ